MRLLSSLLIAASVWAMLAPVAVAGKIEAIKGKQYTLTTKHGPWMVMVAVFSEPPAEMKQEGIGPEQAAEELVYELRTKGIPAYSFRREQKVESIDTVNRLQQAEKRTYTLDSEYCVLAGNYKTLEENNSLAKRTLTWIKQFQPTSLAEGGIYKPTPGQPSLLSGAFLTINPMLDPAEVKKHQRDPEIVRFNSHYDHSLLENPGKYTVAVASFYPNSVTLIGASASESGNKKLKKGGFEEASNQAWQVMRFLREKGFEAYVYHDHKKSIVTIGAFNSLQDPGIAKIQQTLGAQYKQDPATGQTMLLGEVIVLPSQDGTWMCTFDPSPTVMEVPFKN